MSSYVTPEMILRSAEEYMNLDQKQNAFNLLFEYLTGKKSRPWSQALEKIMFIIIDLALEFDKKELLSMPLNNYKFSTQNNNIASLETVLNYFGKASEEKHEAISKLITPQIVATIEDLETEDPSELFIWAFDVDSRTEKSIIRDAMKRLWETYKILIDITARNKKLEDFYQRTLQKAFNFCKKYKRRTEFKRLCELTRSHLNSVLKTSAADLAKMPNAIDLSNVDTNDKQIQIRFELLEYIQEFELWQESIKTLEDIHHIMQKRRSAAKSKTLYDYFEHLSKVFLRSEFFYYSTVAFFNHFSLLRTRQKNVSSEELIQKSNTFVLSVLCIPPVLHENLQTEDTRVRATSLLSSESNLPSKSDLILYIKKHNILDLCTKEVREIYFLIEESKNMIDLSKNSEPLLKIIKEKYSIFHKQLQNNIILKLLTLLSKLYTKIKIDNFSKFLGSLDSSHCDQLIHTASLSDYIKVRIDHGRRLLIFENDVQEMKNLSLKFVNFSEDLKEVIYSIDNKKEQGKEQKVMQDLREEARKYAESATGALNRRLQIIQDLRKVEREQNKQRVQPEERVTRQAEPVSRPVDKQVNAAAAKRADTLATFKIQAKLNLIKKLKEVKGFKIGKRKIEDFNDEELENMTLEALEKAQGDWEKKEKERDEAAIRNAFKRADHYERAKREVFVGTLKKNWENAKGEKEEILKAHKENFEKMIEYKKKMVKAEQFRGEFTRNLVDRKLEEFENEMEVYREKIIDNFKQKILEAARESLKSQIEAQEAERKRKEEQLIKEKERLEKDREDQAKGQSGFGGLVRNTARAEDMQKQAEVPRTGGFTRSDRTAEEAKTSTGAGFQRSELKPKEESKEAPKFFRSSEKKNPFGDAKPVETAAPVEDGGWRTATKKQETKTDERPKFGFTRGTGTTSTTTTTTSGTTSGGPPKFSRGPATTTETKPAQSTGGWRK